MLPIKKRRRMPKPEWLADKKIRRVLCMPKEAEFVRCPARCNETVKRLVKAGDHSHKARAHVCHECRCTRVAGQDTHGDFYGIGKDTGHYGVGFCSYHEKGRRAKAALQFARNHVREIQNYNRTEQSGDDYSKIIRYDAEQAERDRGIRESMALVESTLNEYRLACTEGGTSLTEKIGKGIGPITDKTRMELALKIATTLSRLELDRFTLSSSDYIHIDELRIRLPQMLALANRFLHDEKDREQFLLEFKVIWSTARRGINHAKKKEEIETAEV